MKLRRVAVPAAFTIGVAAATALVLAPISDPVSVEPVDHSTERLGAPSSTDR